MGQFGEVLFSGSRFLFRALSPILILFAIIITLTVDHWSTERAILVVSADALALLLVLALYSPTRFWWAARGVTAIVFALYLAYSIDEVRNGKLSQDSWWDAARGLLVIGVPCLLYTIFGRFRRRATPEKDSEPAPEKGEDSLPPS
jgi:hypothetical protein